MNTTSYEASKRSKVRRKSRILQARQPGPFHVALTLACACNYDVTSRQAGTLISFTSMLGSTIREVEVLEYLNGLHCHFFEQKMR